MKNTPLTRNGTKSVITITTDVIMNHLVHSKLGKRVRSSLSSSVALAPHGAFASLLSYIRPPTCLWSQGLEESWLPLWLTSGHLTSSV